MPSVLVIEDDSSILENIQLNLENYGFTVWKASNGADGLELFKSNAQAVDVVVTAMKMPGMPGLDILKEILAITPFMGVIVMTGHEDMENAVTAMREGAFNYLLKPFPMEKLTMLLQKAIEKKNILLENIHLQRDLVEKNRHLQGIHDSVQRILMNFAPLKLPDFSAVDTAYIYRSCDKVGGDMIDAFEAGSYLFFYIFDVCSHGIIAAINTIFIKAFFCRMKNYCKDVDIQKILRNDFHDLNLELCAYTPSAVFATLFAGCIDKKSSQLYYVSAGHIDQYLIQKDTLISLPSTGTILGSFENADYEVNQYRLSPGDKLLLFTDGLSDIWKKESKGENDLETFIEQRKTDSISDMVDSLNTESIKLVDGAFEDDLTLLGLQVKSESFGKELL